MSKTFDTLIHQTTKGYDPQAHETADSEATVCKKFILRNLETTWLPYVLGRLVACLLNAATHRSTGAKVPWIQRGVVMVYTTSPVSLDPMTMSDMC
eukprot:2098961-Amphidinium_carterae.5